MRETTVPFVQAEVRVLYGINNAGEQVVTTTYCTDGEDDSVPDYFTGLLMLEVAKVDFLRRHNVFGVQ